MHCENCKTQEVEIDMDEIIEMLVLISITARKITKRLIASESVKKCKKETRTYGKI